MLQTVSKSQFKPQALEYLRMVEKTKKPLIITHAGRPVVRVEPYMSNGDEIPAELKKSVISYKHLGNRTSYQKGQTLSHHGY